MLKNILIISVYKIAKLLRAGLEAGFGSRDGVSRRVIDRKLSFKSLDWLFVTVENIFEVGSTEPHGGIPAPIYT